MKTLVIRGQDRLPGDLMDIVRRGSTSVDEVSTRDLSTFISREGLGVDRLVFWSGRQDPDVRALALNYATAAGPERRARVVFITAQPGEDPIDGMTRDEVLVWPRDAEKLRLMFMTGG